ncbi:hypothetical protein LTR17_021686 [Elasticomyces elasticus]|nr:hypothetical protein LTR17_021686 [Elasticomyces elasticus]
MQAVARGRLQLDVRLGAFGYDDENILTAQDWQRYYDNTSHGPIDLSWPFKTDSELDLNNMMQRSIDQDSKVRRVLRTAAQRHGQHAVVACLDNGGTQGATANKWRLPCW